MIQIQSNASSAGGFAPTTVGDPIDDTVLPDNASQAAQEPGALPMPGGDPLARFGALYTMHPQVQRFGYAAPGGSGAGTQTSNKAPTPAGVQSVPSDKDPPITASGVQGGKAWMERGNQLLMAKRYGEAIAAYQEGFRTYPDRAFILNEASAQLDSGHFAEAVLTYERYLGDPDAPRADEARAAMERARAQLGGREVTAAGLVEATRLAGVGAQAYHEGRFADALAAFEQAYELNPLADLRYDQAACLHKMGLRYAAADRYDAYVAQAPNANDATKVTAVAAKLREQADLAPITATGIDGGREWMTRGNRLLQAHRYGEAIAAYQEGFRTYPDRAFILNEAAAQLDSGKFAEAVLTYERYLSDPDAPRADEARAAMERARAQMGGREVTATGIVEAGRRSDLGAQAYRDGRFQEALAAFEQAYELYPHADLRYNQAACLQKMGLPELAAQRYEAYLAQAPGARDATKVRVLIDKLHTQAFEAARAAFDRGQAAFQDGRWNDAASAFAQAYEQKPMPQFLYNMGSAYERAGDTPRAVRSYQLYLNQSPNAADAGQVRDRIERLQQAAGNGLMKP